MTEIYIFLGLAAIAGFSIWMYGMAKESEGSAAAKEKASEAARKVETDMATEMNKEITDVDLAKRFEDRSK